MSIILFMLLIGMTAPSMSAKKYMSDNIIVMEEEKVEVKTSGIFQWLIELIMRIFGRGESEKLNVTYTYSVKGSSVTEGTTIKVKYSISNSGNSNSYRLFSETDGTLLSDSGKCIKISEALSGNFTITTTDNVGQTRQSYLQFYKDDACKTVPIKGFYTTKFDVTGDGPIGGTEELVSFGNYKLVPHYARAESLGSMNYSGIDTNCLCYAFAYIQRINFDKYNGDYYKKVHVCPDKASDYNLTKHTDSNNLHTAYKKIVGEKKAVGLYATTTTTTKDVQHYMAVIGVTTASINKYYKDGKFTPEFYAASESTIKKTLYLLDPYGDNNKPSKYNAGGSIPYYSGSPIWKFDSSIWY